MVGEVATIMIDLHTHSLLSDGELLPVELVRRAEAIGCDGIAITDHVDFSNVEFVMNSLKKLEILRGVWDITVLFGVEITHVPPPKLGKIVELSRKLGAEVVIVHGETTVEPVEKGTNKVACKTDGVDILAHPGLISEDEAQDALDRGIMLELSARCGHNRTNGHVVRTAKEVGAELVVNTDAHSPSDLITHQTALEIAMGSGLREDEAENILKNAYKFVEGV
jgi:histidinol phosphatase-like PHP family hydrolase